MVWSFCAFTINILYLEFDLFWLEELIMLYDLAAC